MTFWVTESSCVLFWSNLTSVSLVAGLNFPPYHQDARNPFSPHLGTILTFLPFKNSQERTVSFSGDREKGSIHTSVLTQIKVRSDNRKQARPIKDE